MKKSELIKKLNEISNEDFDVVLVDWGKNLNADSAGDATGVGMYNNFDVNLDINVNENHPHEHFISLCFDNDDYNSDGVCVKDTLIEALEFINDVKPEEIGNEESLMIIKSHADEALEFAYNFIE